MESSSNSEFSDDFTPASEVSFAVDEIKANIKNGQFRISKKRGKSKVWDIFGHIIGENDLEIPNYLACRFCYAVLKYTGASSNLVRHKCYKDNKSKDDSNVSESEDIKPSMTRAVKNRAGQNSRSFSTASDSGINHDVSLAIEIKSNLRSGLYRISKRYGKSKVWDVFGNVVGENNMEIPNYVACRSCYAVLSFTGASSNLVRHRCYKDCKSKDEGDVSEPGRNANTKASTTKSVTAGAIENSRPFCIISDSGIKDDVSLAIEIKANIRNGKFRISKKHGKSKVWDVFGKVIGEKNIEIPDYVACRTCYAVLKYTGASCNLVRHKCYKENKSKDDGNVLEPDINFDTKASMIRAVTSWAVQNCRPFSIISDSGIQEVISLAIEIGSRLGPNVNVNQLLPHPTTVSQNVTDLYNKELSSVKEEIALINRNGYTITSDAWTDSFSQKTYICIILHYIIDGSMKIRLLAMLCMNDESATGLFIRNKVEECLESFGLHLDDAIIVTDRGSNMIDAFQECARIHCMNHLLNDFVETAFMEIPELRAMEQKCDKLAKYFKRSEQNSKFYLSLTKGDCLTRWNIIFYTMKSIEDNWYDVNTILMEKNKLHLIDSMTLSDLKAVTHVLSKIEETSKLFEGDSYPTIQWVIPRIHALQKLCNQSDPDRDISQKMKSHLQNYIETVILRYITKYHRIALYLFPPTNQLRHVDSKETIDDCRDMLSLLCRGNKEIKTEDYDELLADFIDPLSTETDEQIVEREIISYSNIRVQMTANFNVLKWWQENGSQYPLLYSLSCKIFAIPASSASSEEVFSQARNLICEKRISIAGNDDMVNKLMFLNINTKK